MKILKNYSIPTFISAIIMFVMLSTASAATINIDAGEFKFTGDTYVDTTLPLETRAVGRITTITQGGDIIWSSGGGNYLNFLAEGIAPVVTPTAPIFSYVAAGGTVNLYESASDIFDISLNYGILSSIIAATDLYLSTEVVGNIVGIATGVSYSSNGFLDVTGGSSGDLFDTNSRPTFLQGANADLSFGLSGSNNINPLVHSDYQYISSADIQGAANPVSEPETVALLGLGLIGLGVTSIKRKEDFSGSTA